MQETRTTWVLANRSTVSITDYNARRRQKTYAQKSLKHKKDLLRQGYHGTIMPFSYALHGILTNITAATWRKKNISPLQVYLPGWLSYISLRLSYQLQLKKLSRCAFSRWTWFHAGDFRPELPNFVIDYDVPVVSRKVCVLIDTLLSNKTRCESIINILMTPSLSSGHVHTHSDILEKWDFFQCFSPLSTCERRFRKTQVSKTVPEV